MEEGLFRYELDGIKTRVVPGNVGFVLQVSLRRSQALGKENMI